MIYNEIELISLDRIYIGERARSKTDDKKIKELALSISEQGLIHPILIRKNPNGAWTLIAGEHRLEAFRLLHGDKHPCRWDEYDNWTLVPCRIVIGSEADFSVIELEENIKRSPMFWQDEVNAMTRLHENYSDKEPNWSIEKSAEKISLTASHMRRVLAVGRAFKTETSRAKNAETLRAAINIVERETQRAVESTLDQIKGVEREPIVRPSTGHPESHEEAPAPAASVPVPFSIIQGDFLEWLYDYSGPKFNFIHCDFPYGIDHQKSSQGYTNSYEAYEDNPELYIQLLTTMLVERNKFMMNSAHIMFWFSMKFYEETLSIVRDCAPELDVNIFPMIWHKSDNKGVLPDATRGPRRVYETCLLMSRNDRKIIQAVSNLYSAPTTKNFHVSEKPVSVLKHFYRMLIDEHSVVLDPTCGSGNSIVAALMSGAKSGLGIELNQKSAELAQSNLNAAIRLHIAQEA